MNPNPSCKYLLPLVALTLVQGCSTTTPLPKSDPNPPEITWSLQEVGASTVQQITSATPMPVKIAAGKKYNIGLHASNPGGVKQLTLDGSGFFDAYTRQIGNQTFTAPNKLNGSIPHQESNQTPDAQGNVPTTVNLVLTPFEYDNISCGMHHYGNTPGTLEYFAGGGILTLTATSANFFGKTSSSQLTLTP